MYALKRFWAVKNWKTLAYSRCKNFVIQFTVTSVYQYCKGDPQVAIYVRFPAVSSFYRSCMIVVCISECSSLQYTFVQAFMTPAFFTCLYSLYYWQYYYLWRCIPVPTVSARLVPNFNIVAINYPFYVCLSFATKVDLGIVILIFIYDRPDVYIHLRPYQAIACRKNAIHTLRRQIGEYTCRLRHLCFSI